MHSRIFQLTKEKADPIIADDYYDHWFTNSIADYVMDSEGDIDWLVSCSNGALEQKGNKIIIKDKSKYFERKYRDFMQGLKKFTETSFEDFQKPSFSIYSLKVAANDQHSFYIEDCGEWGGLTTFDEFMRRVNNGDEFFIGVTVDYHF